MTEDQAKKIAQEMFRKAYDLQMAGDLEDAIEQYKRSIEIFPTAEAHTFLGWTYSFQRRYDDAIRECKEAIKIDPDFGNPYNDIGAYLIERGRLDEAIPWFKKAMAAKRYDSYCYPYYNLGRVYERKGNWQEALKCYESSLKANPDYVLARKALNRLKAILN
ncbi:MAG: tetratricopeptide repeat protein [Candidatus Omnitrophica bacterium]|nr:tetratricopeptide repeat protein [Candidatus Omnitrophota bacterium]